MWVYKLKLMRQHANRIKTELIARKGQQLTGQSPTICACGKSGMHQLADHMSITFMPSKGQDKRSLGFTNSQARRDINLPERKLPPTHPPIHIMPEE